MQVRHRFFGNHVRAKGIETEDQKTGTRWFHAQIQDAVEYQVCLEIKIAKPNLTCITPFNISMTMRNRFFGQDVGTGVA